MALFSHSAAAEYALKYALKENSAYPPFPNDCTSFVSQAMLAGGWKMIGGSFFDRQDDNVWWWGKSIATTASYTWGGAHNFSKFLETSGRGKRSTRDDLKIGDVVQIAKADGHVFHTMIVTGNMCSKSGDGLHMSYHTANTQNKALSAIEKKYATGGYSFIYWKLSKVV